MSIDHESAVMFLSPKEPKMTLVNRRKGHGKSQLFFPGVIIGSVLLVTLCVLGLILTLVQKTPDNEMAHRRSTVINMTQEAWQAYRKHAWGQPVLGNSTEYLNSFSSGLTLIESLSTLWLMGLDEEFAQGRQWVEKTFLSPADLATSSHFNVHWMMPRYLGSLLSTYTLTGDSLFLKKAAQLFEWFKVAFEHNSELPKKYIGYSQANNTTDLQLVANEKLQSSAEVSQTLELRYWAYLNESTQVSFWRRTLQRIRQTTSSSVKAPFINSTHVRFGKMEPMSLHGFYSCLVKSFFLSNGIDTEGLRLVLDALEVAKIKELIVRSATGLLHIRHQKLTYFDEHMEFEDCNWGAILGLASVALTKSTSSSLESKYTEQAGRLLQMAKDIVITCQLGAEKRKEGLTPQVMHFAPEEMGNLSVDNDSVINLSPQMAESLFVLWRITGEAQYREYAWKMVQAIDGHTRDLKEGGFRNIEPFHVQSPELIGGTLKYLYLIFADDDQLPLDQWVFNAVGQPLPICGHSDANRKC